MRRPEIGVGPAIDAGEAGMKKVAERLRGGPAIVDPDLVGAEAPGPADRIVDPPDGADVEDMTRALTVADRQGRLAPVNASEPQLPGGLAATIALDSQVVVSRKRLHRRRDGSKGVDDFVGNRG